MLALLLLFHMIQSGLADYQPLWGTSFAVPGNATYDYIVIGAGTAGNAVATRLAQNGSFSVAVIEAGTFYEISNGNKSVVPGYCFTAAVGVLPNSNHSSADWGYLTVPQAGLNQRMLHYSRGKTFGGSSALNYIVYHRGTIGSYQKWADQVDDQSYTFENFLHFMKKSATFTPPNYSPGKRFSNTTLNFDETAFDNSLDGPLQVSYSNWATPFYGWAQIGLAAIGILPNNGFNSGSLFGSMWSSQTINPKNEHRSSSQTSYLDLAISTTNLQVYPETLAKRILFDSNKTAIGVVVSTNCNSYNYTLTARKEVIISAGAFNSAQLLMVSGIGPASGLQQHNIPIISNLSGVGQNMWDHCLFAVSYRVNLVTSSILQNNLTFASLAAQEYLQNQSGILCAPAGYLGWEKLPSPFRTNLTESMESSLSTFPTDWPELEYLAEDTPPPGTSDPKDGYNYATISAALVAPLSRGNLTISSPDTSDPPVINPNWLTDPTDAQLAIAGLKRARTAFASLSTHNITHGPEIYPGPHVETDAHILEYIRNTSNTVYHAAATCAMGVAGDPMAVVDSKARVFGVQALRVVDISAFPFLTPGHPQATVYALAEKIAEDILSG